MQQLKAGSASAFTTLYNMYSERLYYNVFSLVKDRNTAEELVQDIFSKIWKQRANISIEKSFSSYLFAASRNRVFDFFKQLRRNHELYSRIKAIASENYSHIEEALLRRENQHLLQRAIETLPPQRRRAFELCKIEGLSYRQAGEVMGISISTVKDHMATALDAIRTYISKNSEIAAFLIIFFWNPPV
ncbi:MAG: RNA polymerase sigma-70 factor [Chitinophagaceae bacterium]|nr:RNA polymerase sigma-70 factor [Chitinophagaceae bacterium]